MGNDISTEIKNAQFDDYITEYILMYLPYTRYMSLNKEYYSLGIKQIRYDDAKKILTKIIYGKSLGHEQLLDHAASIVRHISITFNKSMPLSYFTILHKHGIIPTHVLAQLLINPDFEHFHEYILSDSFLVKTYPNYVISYSIRKCNTDLFAEIVSYTELELNDIRHICLYLPPNELIKFIDIAVEHQSIHVLLTNVIINAVINHKRDDIIDIIQDTTARGVITNELLQEIAVLQSDMRFVNLVEKIR